MQTISTEARQVLLSGGGLAYSYANVFNGGTKQATLQVTGGNIVSDRTAAIPRSVTCTLAGFDAIIPDLGALPPAKTFADGAGTFGDGPFGDNYNRTIRGLVLPAVTTIDVYLRLWLPVSELWESIPLGRFRVATVGFSHTTQGVEVTITGFDVARSVAKAGYTAPYIIGKNTNIGTALTNLIQSRAPGTAVARPATSFKTPRLALLPVAEANPWTDALKLAWSAGWELLTDRSGGVVAQVPGDPGSGTAVWDLTEARLIKTATELDDEQAINTVVVTGATSEDVPVRAVRQRTAGQWGSDQIGVRTKYEETEFVGADDVAEATTQAGFMAQNILSREAGLVDTLELEAAGPLPHIDPGDLVDVTDQTLDLTDTTYAVERVTFDLNPTVATRLTVSRRLA